MTVNNQYGWIINEFIKSLNAKYNSKILWGSRSIYRKDWIYLKKIINQCFIKTVIEYGCGLSTELMFLEGCKIYSLEDVKWWADHNRVVFKGIKEIEIVDYKIGEIPDLKQSFDLAFVDGPKDDRTETINHAMRHSKLIYCHDRRQRELIKENKDWEVFNIFPKYKDYFYQKVL